MGGRGWPCQSVKSDGGGMRGGCGDRTERAVCSEWCCLDQYLLRVQSAVLVVPHAHRAAPAAQLGSECVDQLGLPGEVAPAEALQPGARARHQQRLARRTLRAAHRPAPLAAHAAHAPGLLPQLGLGLGLGSGSGLGLGLGFGLGLG